MPSLYTLERWYRLRKSVKSCRWLAMRLMPRSPKLKLRYGHSLLLTLELLLGHKQNANWCLCPNGVTGRDAE